MVAFVVVVVGAYAGCFQPVVPASGDLVLARCLAGEAVALPGSEGGGYPVSWDSYVAWQRLQSSPFSKRPDEVLLLPDLHTRRETTLEDPDGTIGGSGSSDSTLFWWAEGKPGLRWIDLRTGSGGDARPPLRSSFAAGLGIVNGTLYYGDYDPHEIRAFDLASGADRRVAAGDFSGDAIAGDHLVHFLDGEEDLRVVGLPNGTPDVFFRANWTEDIRVVWPFVALQTDDFEGEPRVSLASRVWLVNITTREAREIRSPDPESNADRTNPVLSSERLAYMIGERSSVRTTVAVHLSTEEAVTVGPSGAAEMALWKDRLVYSADTSARALMLRCLGAPGRGAGP